MSWCYESICFGVRQSVLFFLLPVQASKIITSSTDAAPSETADMTGNNLNKTIIPGARAQSSEPHQCRQISMAELSKANRPEQGWVAIRGQVYDLTAFASKHPGGRNIILAAVGRDCTITFETSHSDLVAKGLKKYHIGELTDNELPLFPPRSEFGKTLNKRIKEYFVETKQDPKVAPWMFVRYATVMALMMITYYSIYFNSTVTGSTLLQTIFCCLFGFVLAQVNIHIVHDGSHGSITHSPVVWQSMAALHDILSGCSSLNWFYQHVLGHHVYTNIDGADPDIAVNHNDIRRIRPWQVYTAKYAKQYIYAPIIYCFLMGKTRLADTYIVHILKSNDNIRINALTPQQHAVFWGGKAFLVTYRLLIPYFFTSLSLTTIVMLFFGTDFVMSWALALIFQANHVVDEVEWPLPNANGVMEQDWARLQVETAQDYAHDSWLTTIITGGLNYQVVHHLFPHHSQFYYPAMAPIIKKTCAEFGVNYMVKDTFMDAFGGHIGLLKYLASGEAAFGHSPHVD